MSSDPHRHLRARPARSAIRGVFAAALATSLAATLGGCGALAGDTAATVDALAADPSTGAKAFPAVAIDRAQSEAMAQELVEVPAIVGESGQAAGGRVPSSAMTAALTVQIRNALADRIRNRPDDALIEQEVAGFTQSFPKVDAKVATPLLRSLYTFDLVEPVGAPLDESVLRAAYDHMGQEYWQRTYGKSVCLTAVPVDSAETASKLRSQIEQPRNGRSAEQLLTDAIDSVPESPDYGRPTYETSQLGCESIRSFVSQNFPVDSAAFIDTLQRQPVCNDQTPGACSAADLPFVSEQLTPEQQANPPHVVLVVTERKEPTFEAVRSTLEKRLAVPAVREVFDMPVSVDRRYGTWDPLFVRVISPVGPIDGTMTMPTRLQEQAGILPVD